jgi:hypothetical protein
MNADERGWFSVESPSPGEYKRYPRSGSPARLVWTAAPISLPVAPTPRSPRTASRSGQGRQRLQEPIPPPEQTHLLLDGFDPAPLNAAGHGLLMQLARSTRYNVVEPFSVQFQAWQLERLLYYRQQCALQSQQVFLRNAWPALSKLRFAVSVL